MTTQTEALKLALDGGGLYEITGRIEDIDKCIVHRSVIKETLAQPEQEPVAYLVTGPYEKTAFSDIGSANAYCRGLNKGFDTDAYIVSPLYTTPPQRKPLTDVDWKARALKAEKAVEELAYAGFQRKPLTDEEFTTAIEVEGIPVEDVELVYAIKDLVEAAHGIKE